MQSPRSFPATALACALWAAACAGEPNAATDVSSPMSVPTGSSTSTPTSTSAPEPEPEPEVAQPYAPGAWRLVQPAALGPLVLWFSQIVIRHAESRPEVSFNLANWTSVATPPRSRAEARAWAEQLAALAAQSPERFAELARLHSEDWPSRDEGGAVGGASAIQLSPWPQVLDALCALKAGQLSSVVETAYGFHIFRRAEPPPEEQVSGAHILIGHDAAAWGAYFSRGSRPPRTRAAAQTLADSIYREAQAAPERFTELVRRYSEHRDAVADGDIGAWSTREVTAFPPRTERLSELAVGQVGAPIETHLGFEILQRTAPRPRQRYRAAVLTFGVGNLDESAAGPEPQDARAAARQTAEATLAQLRVDPAGFEALGPSVSEWEEGHEAAALTLALAPLRPGQLTPLVDTEYGYLLARRLEPTPAHRPRPESEFPVPGTAELVQFLASQPWAESSAFLRHFATEAGEALGLVNDVRARLAAAHELASLDSGAPLEARRELLVALFERTRTLLDAASFLRYEAALSRDAAALLPRATGRRALGL